MLLKINGIPKLCHGLTELQCQRLVSVCGENSLPDVCGAKLLVYNFTYGGRLDSPFLLTKHLYRMFDGAREKVFHVTMSAGHNYLHAVAEAIAKNAGG